MILTHGNNFIEITFRINFTADKIIEPSRSTLFCRAQAFKAQVPLIQYNCLLFLMNKPLEADEDIFFK